MNQTLTDIAQALRGLRRRRRYAPINRASDIRWVSKPAGALGADDVVVIAVGRNERRRIPHFLAHYRRLGAARFVYIDNASDDGSADYLAAQPDVDLFSTSYSFRDAKFGVAWWHYALEVHGKNRWHVVADVDEHFVYDEAYGALPEFCARLKRAGILQARSFMLDMYPKGSLSATRLADDAPILDTFRYFDRASYRVVERDDGRQGIYGGPRGRLFGERGMTILDKYPLVYWRNATFYSDNHRLLPITPREPVFSALLHFKFMPWFGEENERLAREGQHDGGGSSNRMYADWARGADDIFDPAHSVAYTRFDDVRVTGLVGDPPWDGGATP